MQEMQLTQALWPHPVSTFLFILQFQGSRYNNHSPSTAQITLSGRDHTHPEHVTAEILKSDTQRDQAFSTMSSNHSKKLHFCPESCAFLLRATTLGDTTEGNYKSTHWCHDPAHYRAVGRHSTPIPDIRKSPQTEEITDQR